MVLRGRPTFLPLRDFAEILVVTRESCDDAAIRQVGTVCLVVNDYSETIAKGMRSLISDVQRF
jgi:hypothetical protein